LRPAGARPDRPDAPGGGGRADPTRPPRRRAGGVPCRHRGAGRRPSAGGRRGGGGHRGRAGTAPTRIWVEDDLVRASYTQCLNVLLPARTLGASDKIVFFGVLSYAWQDDAAWPSIEMLTARVGLSRATVLRSLGELKRVGLLKVRRRGQGLVNFY